MPHGMVLLCFVLLTTGVLPTCAPTPKHVSDPASSATPKPAWVLPAPQLTRVEGFGDHLELTWHTFRGDRDVIGGYNVYVSTSSGLSNLPDGDPELKDFLYGGSAYPGDTDGIIDSESINITPVVIGVRYFVHVRTVFPDGHQSHPSAEREVIARPRGFMTLHPRFSSENDGFSFASDRNVPSMSDSNDVYLFAGKDGLYLASPSRLNPLLRGTRFASLGPSVSIEDYPACPEPSSLSDKVAVQPGHSVVVLMMDGRMAKMRPRELAGGHNSLSMVFDYVYQPVFGEARF